MSINSMNRSALAGNLEGTGPSLRPSSKTPTTKALADLVRYVPTEVITLYIAGLGVADAAENVAKGQADETWILFAVAAVVTPVAVLLDWLIKRRQIAEPADAGGIPAYNLIAATIAFVAWAFAMPASPFSTLSFYDAAWAGFIALAVSIALGKADQLFVGS